MNISNKQFTNINQMASQLEKRSGLQKKSQQSYSFSEILTKQNEESEVKFSKHASERLNTRNIQLSEEQMKRLNSGTNLARTKGIKESLVLIDQLAFIVSVKNNMVITAVDKGEDTVFTNIDGAVIS